MRGRKPTPTHLKLLKGNPGKRKLNATEPQLPEPGDLRCPEFLEGHAVELWNRLAPVLSQAGVLTGPDKPAFEALCHAYGQWREAEEQVQRHGRVYKTDTNYWRVSAWARLADEAHARFMRGCVEFGLTPSARSRVHAEPTEVIDEFMAHRIQRRAMLPD